MANPWDITRGGGSSGRTSPRASRDQLGALRTIWEMMGEAGRILIPGGGEAKAFLPGGPKPRQRTPHLAGFGRETSESIGRTGRALMDLPAAVPGGKPWRETKTGQRYRKGAGGAAVEDVLNVLSFLPVTKLASLGRAGATGGKLARAAARGAEAEAAFIGRAPKIAAAVGDQPPAVQQLRIALSQAKPIGAEQRRLYAAERVARIGKAEQAAAQVPGEAGYFARLGQLKGQLPKAAFEPLKLAKPQIDELYDLVAKNPRLTSWNRLSTQSALHKLLTEARVPPKGDLELLARVFGSELVKDITALGPKKKPLLGAAESIAGLTRGMMASFDFSAPLRQGVVLGARHPILASKSMLPQIRAAFSRKAYKDIVDEIVKRPTFELMERSGLSLSALSDFPLAREEAFAAAQLAEKLPGIGRIVSGSNRAYSTFLTKFRADAFDNIIKGVPRESLTTNTLKQIGDWVNTTTGRGSLGRLAPMGNLLSTTIFAPRLIASRLKLINPRYYMRMAQNPVLRKEVLTTAAAFYGSMLTVLGLAKAAGAGVVTDWRSADFGKISIPSKGGIPEATIRIVPAVFGVGMTTYESPDGPRTRFDPTGGLQVYIRLIGQLYHGEAISSVTGEPQRIRGRPLSRGEILQRFIENKMSPVASLVRDILFKEARPYDYTSTEAIVSRVTPMIIQDWWELTSAGEQSLGQAVDEWLQRRGLVAPREEEEQEPAATSGGNPWLIGG